MRYYQYQDTPLDIRCLTEQSLYFMYEVDHLGHSGGSVMPYKTMLAAYLSNDKN